MNNKTKLKKPQISYAQSCQLRALHQYGGVKVADIIKDKRRFPGFAAFSSATLYRHAKLPIDGTEVFDKRTLNKGRPSKLTPQDRRNILRQITVLRQFEGSFSSRRLQMCSVGNKVSNSTVRRFLHTKGYKFRTTRKKGLLSSKDLKRRLKFAKKMRRLKLGHEFWTKGISFYLDATGFIYKVNPMDQARAPNSKEWRLISEGTKPGCTSKGKKEGNRQANGGVGGAKH